MWEAVIAARGVLRTIKSWLPARQGCGWAHKMCNQHACKCRLQAEAATHYREHCQDQWNDLNRTCCQLIKL